MSFSVSEFSKEHDFEIRSVSYAGNPQRNTAMFITKKVEYLLGNLKGVEECLVFVEDSMDIPEELCRKNVFVKSPTPQKEYARFVNRMAEDQEQKEWSRKYTLTEGGYYIGENVTLGKDVRIEPRCLIGHDVVIGDHAWIKSGACIKYARIGDRFIAGENCAIGTSAFTMADDENGDKIRIPTLGGVIIGNDVEIGALSNISRGSAGNTVIEDHVKIDVLVHVGHDGHLHRNVEITAGGIIGGFGDIHEGVFLGVNAATRNRITIGEGARVSMGSVVTKSIAAGATMTGNFAIPHQKFLDRLKETLQDSSTAE